MTVQDSSLPYVEFSTDGVVEAQRFEFYRAFVSNVWDIRRIEGREKELHSSGRTWRLNSAIASEYSHGPIRQYRKSDNHSEPRVTVRVYLGGTYFATSGDRVRVLQPGDVYLLDSRIEGFSQGSCNLIGVTLPAASVGYEVTKHPRIISFPGDSAMGKVLFHTLDLVMKSVRGEIPFDSAETENALIGVVRCALHGMAADEGAKREFTRARSRVIKEEVAKTAGTASTDPDKLAERFNVSRATLYRIFEDEGGVARFVSDRRLDFAMHALLQEPLERGRVVRVAEQLRFFDKGHFSRSFRRRYGLSPSDILPFRAEPGDTKPVVEELVRPDKASAQLFQLYR